MMTTVLLALFHSFGLIIFYLGLQGLFFIPLSMAYEIWKKRFLRIVPEFTGLVTVLIPAYNERKTIRAAVESVLASGYGNLEVIVINDGSTDSTEAEIADYIKSARIRYITKTNGGKASALNIGLRAARGEVVIFTDADSVFLPGTVRQMVRWFGDPKIDAVCGNDAPLDPGTYVQKFLAITTHIGTGFVRRALSYLRCLPIITGNLGAVRTRVLRDINGFKEVWGEDLELTFRLYKNRSRIVFDPDPLVMAECPGTIGGLWRQRIRWVRSYIKIALMHRDMFFNASYRPFSLYLPVNFLNMAVVPVLQIGLLVLIPWAYQSGAVYFTDTVEVLTYLGVIFFFIIAVYSILLDRAYGDLKYLPYGLLILPLSYFYNAVTAYSWVKELQGAQENWVKVERRPSGARSASNRLRYASAALSLAVLSAVSAYYYIEYVRQPQEMSKGAFYLGLSTHFDAWGDWRKGLSSVLNRKDVGMAKVVGVSAGRPEWAYFKWKGHENDWSNHQKGAKEDMVAKAAATFHRSGFKVAAFIDIYGPKYIKEHPGTAAIGFDGKVNTEQLCFTEIVSGGYGRLILDMVGYISENYPVDIIDLTEMPYYSYSYNERDLKSYMEFTKRAGWPMTSTGVIDRDDPSIWQWRSALMEGYIGKAAAIAHRYGKELYVDVPVSWADFRRNGADSGLDYGRVLKHADSIVVWDYYYLEGQPPSVSEALSKYLVRTLPKDSFYVSLGLWGKTRGMSPQELEQGLGATLRGGASRIWITPDSMITDEHWKAIRPYLSGVKRPL